MVFDKTNQKSFNSAGNWIQSIYKVKATDTPVVVAGNKSDLVDKQIVT